MTNTRASEIKAALAACGVDRLVLAIHDQSFPSDPGEESGHGTPYGKGAEGFLQFVTGLGFNVVQLGPQGLTSRSDPSPYNSSVFAKNPLSLAPWTLCRDEVVAEALQPYDIEALVKTAGVSTDDRVDYGAAWRYIDSLLDRVQERLPQLRARSSPLATRFDNYRHAQTAESGSWFERDTVYECLAAIACTDDWRAWGPPVLSPLDRRLYAPLPGEERATALRRREVRHARPDTAERFALSQYLLRLQHASLRGRMRELGLALYGDAQIGFSHRDRWAWGSLFLRDYLMGAPPSRSNPAGQPWGYPVLDPPQLEHGAAGMDMVRARFGAMLDDYDGFRIDHPHGLVCPWVYRSDDPDPIHAVQNGARLNCSPDLPDHPALAQFSLVRPEQLCHSPDCTRYADEYVLDLLPEQTDRFGIVIDTILQLARKRSVHSSAVLCEVLSTWPAPLKAVMTRHGLGRFCVTQKALANDPDDVYRSENTKTNDWIMVGNHDTQPLWKVVNTQGDAWRRDRAGLLALHLAAGGEERERLHTELAADKRAFCKAMFTELFLAPARNVSVFFTDLFGIRETYNQPGTVGAHNWTLRVPRDFRRLYAERCSCGEAFDVASCLAEALRIRSRGVAEGDALGLARRLDNKETA